MSKNIALKTEILRQGITQYWVASQIEMIPSRLSEIVCGWRTPSEDEKERIASVLGKSVSELFSETKND